jgi:hypothetical protein
VKEANTTEHLLSAGKAFVRRRGRKQARSPGDLQDDFKTSGADDVPAFPSAAKGQTSTPEQRWRQTRDAKKIQTRGKVK